MYPIIGLGIAPPAAGGVIDYQAESAAGRRTDGLWGNKVMFAADPSYTRAFTVQGKQIDGPNPVDWLIENGQRVPKLDLPEGAGWHYYATEALLKTAGCYALQIDGFSFSSLIVFKAVDDRSFRNLTRGHHA